MNDRKYEVILLNSQLILSHNLKHYIIKLLFELERNNKIEKEVLYDDLNVNDRFTLLIHELWQELKHF